MHCTDKNIMQRKILRFRLYASILCQILFYSSNVISVYKKIKHNAFPSFYAEKTKNGVRKNYDKAISARVVSSQPKILKNLSIT